MCCQETNVLNLPAEAIEALARYRQLRRDRGWDWGDDRIEFFRWARFPLLEPVLMEFAATGDWAGAIRAAVAGALPPGTVVVRVDADGGLHARTGPARAAIAGRTVPVEVVVDSAAGRDLCLTVAGRQIPVTAGGVTVETVDVDAAHAAFTVDHDGRTLSVDGALRPVAAATLRLSSPRCARWSVTDADGGAWFPDGVLTKWDVKNQPFFHADDVSLPVPATPLRVVCARGVEFGRIERHVTPVADRTCLVEADPPRLFDPAADGWYGGDLHVHMNYSGDLVCTPEDAARMQRGEGLHLVNLVAANAKTSLIYDRAMLDGYAGADLPWSTGDTVARMGVEYRNDLLGHVHALDPSAPPVRYQTGHERSDHPQDWPPNAVACRELRALGATVGYCHPAWDPFPDDWSTDRFFANPRSVEARELVADAALGLVDSIDILSPAHHEGAVFLYHRLLSCGLRLAATAGTDVFLSFSRLRLASNPPGWGRVYAHLGDRALSTAAFKDAIRAGRTIVTNGPWITIEANGHGPGSVLDAAAGDRLTVRARVQGPGVDRLTLVGPDGILATAEPASDPDPDTDADADADADTDAPVVELRFDTAVDAPTWIAAIARGAEHPHTLDASVLAHTTPVYVDVAGARVARAADARWCLRFLDTLEHLVTEHGRFHPENRAEHLGDLTATLDQARAFYRGVAAAATPGQ